MKIVQSGKKRKAISPVLATVILIAITLIAAIAVAGFVFGLFGSFTSTPNVTAQTVACSVAGKDCVVTLQNTGTAPSTPEACSIYGVTGAVTPVATSLVGGGITAYTCTLTAAPSTAIIGASVTGSFSMTSGSGNIQVSFAGSWIT